MKKFTRVLLSLMLVLSLMASATACSSEEESTAPVAVGGQTQIASNDNAGSGESDTAAQPGQAVSHDFTFTYNGTSFGANDEAAPIIEALGDDYSYFESNSCAFQGLDKVYTYSAFIIRTYPVDGVDYISTIEFQNDTVQTAEGVYIGMSQDEVESRYDCSNANYTGNGIILTSADGKEAISFVVSSGAVIGISYSAIVE